VEVYFCILHVGLPFLTCLKI